MVFSASRHARHPVVIRQRYQVRFEIALMHSLNRLRGLEMEPLPARQAQFLDERLAHQRMGKSVARPAAAWLSPTILALSPSSTAGKIASSPSSIIRLSTSNSNSRPSTAAAASTRLVISDRRERRRPITSRTPSGMPSSEMDLASVTHRPSRR